MKNYKFSLVLDKDNFVLRDHRVHGVKIMPGVTFLDLIYRYLNMKGFKLNELSIKNILFKEPIAVTETYDKRVQILLEKSINGRYHILARSKKIKDNHSIDSTWDENLTCELCLDQTPVSKTINLKKLLKQTVHSQDIETIYEIARGTGIDHYDFMKCLGRFHYNDDYVLAEIHLGEFAQNYSSQFYFHPAYLDCSTFFPLIMLGLTLEKPYIPFYIDSFKAFQGLNEDRYWIYAEKHEKSNASQDILANDYEIYNNDGYRVAEIKKFSAKRIRSKSLITRFESVSSPDPLTPLPIPEKLAKSGPKQGEPLLIEQDIRQMIAALQGRPIEEIKVEEGFYDQGLDSKHLLSLVKMLEDKIGVQLYPTLLFEYTTIRDLSRYLENEFGDRYLTGGEKSGEFSKDNILTRPVSDVLYYEDVWERRTIKATPKENYDRLLLFDVDTDSADVLADRLNAPGYPIVVMPGESFAQNGTTRFTVNPLCKDDFRKLLQRLEIQNMLPNKIIYKWSYSRAYTFDDVMNCNLEIDLDSLHLFSQVVMEQKLKEAIILLYVYQNKKFDASFPILAAFSGYAKTIYLENPKFIYKTVEIREKKDSPVTPRDMMDLLLNEFQSHENDMIRYVGTERFVRHLKKVKPDTTIEKSSHTRSAIKEGGVYIITGGAGGLGLIFAEYIAKSARTRLILVGRSALNSSQHKKIQELEALGSEITFVQADMTAFDDVKRMLDQIKSKHKTINGVIHSAGLINDAFIFQKKTEAMKAIIAPKVYGTLYLDRLLKNDPLDFFVLFSSTAGRIGNMGQCDYSFANSFMDHFAQRRHYLWQTGKRNGKTLSLNWPLWADGGMKIDEKMQQWLTLHMGLNPLATHNGIQAFEFSLQYRGPQLMIVAGDKTKLHRLLATDSPDTSPEKQDDVMDIDISSPAPDHEDIAIIGVEGRYPMADDLEEFWANLKNGKDCIVEIPETRWDPEQLDRQTGHSCCRWGGFLDHVDTFDPLFFNISPKEAAFIDPQERLFLQTVWKTMEDAGYKRPDFANQKVGVFVGVMWGQYQMFGARMNNATLVPSSFYASVANRVSYFFNFRGPSLTVDTMCSSSLLAVQMACESIKKKECCMAVAGGVNLSIHPNKYILLSQAGFSAGDGRCRAFGKGGDGYVPGEGVGAVLLKSYQKAVTDGDRIYAVIKGGAVNHAGKTSGYTVPSPIAQAELIETVIETSGIDPRTISYIEAHGTGTSLGDPIEIAGLKQSYQKYTQEKQFCAIGSVKSNIGHLESAAGIASITKVLLQMKHKQLVPSLHAESLNPNIDFEASPFYVQRHLTEWKQPKFEMNGKLIRFPRRAAISAFGAGGTNVHLVLEEYDARPVEQDPEDGSVLIILSARNKERLNIYASQLLNFMAHAMPSGRHCLDLADIAYTLQTGRTEMEERLAFVVSSMQSLQEKLTAFCNGQMGINGVFQGNIETKNDQFSFFMKEEEWAHYMNAMIRKQKLDVLAQLWVIGTPIDWNRLYKNEKRQVVTLPTYPFARERCWIQPLDSGLGIPGIRRRESVVNALHPLIDTNESTLKQEIFKKTFHADEFFLKDHCVAGQHLFPGVGYLEMARVAGEIAGQRFVSALKNIMWAKPIVVNQGNRTVDILLNPKKESVYFEIRAHERENTSLYCNGEIEFMSGHRVIQDEPIDIGAIKSRSLRKISRYQIYNTFEKNGFDYGESFQVLEALYVGEGEAFAELVLPNIREADFDTYGLHPSLMDGALRSIIGVMEHNRKENSNSYVPFSLARMEMIRPLTKTCFAYAKRSDHSNDHMNKFDVVLLNEKGESSVIFHDFTVRAIQKERKDSRILFYETIWESAERNGNKISEGIESSGVVLVFDSHKAVFRELDRLNKAAGGGNNKIILVEPGKDYETLGSGHYCINPGNIYNYELLFQDLDKKGLVPGNIFHLWNILPVETKQKDECGTLDLDHGLYSIMHIFKNMVSIKAAERCRCWFVFHETSGILQPQFESLCGFAHSIPAINPGLSLITVRVDSTEIDPAVLSKLLIDEVSNPESVNGTSVRYANQKRFVKKIHKMDPMRGLNNDTGKKTIHFDSKGVYLITGGLGGLGLIFAQHIARKYNARLVLTGRSSLSSEKEKKIDTIKQAGANVTYIPCDVSDSADVEALIRAVKKRYGKITGILHSAGIIGSKPFPLADQSEFERVLLPKIHGTINLDWATRNEPMDFFILFSSISALMGDFGIGSYASANAFMDGYAVYRNQLQSENKRSGRTLSFNWPFWEEGGMKLPRQEADLFFQYSGMKSLTTEGGTKAFDMAMHSGVSQVIIAWGDVHKIDRVFRIERPPLGNAKVTPGVGSVDHWEPIFQKTKTYLANVIAAALGMPADQINPTDKLEKYGVDSIRIMEINQLLKKDFDSLPLTLLFEYDTIQDLARFIIENFMEALKPVIGEDDIQEKDRPTVSLQNEEFRFVDHTEKKQQKKDGVDSYPLMEILGMPGGSKIDSYLDTYKQRISNGGIAPVSSDKLIKTLIHSNGTASSKATHLLVKTQHGKQSEVMIYGQGRTILLIPGFGYTAPVWSYQLAAWSSEYQVVVVHNPGHGLSAVHDDTSLGALCENILTIFNVLHIKEPFHVVGGSYGGMIAQSLAYKYPEKVASLTLACSFSRISSGFKLAKHDELTADDFQSVLSHTKLSSIIENCKKYEKKVLDSQCLEPTVAMQYIEKGIGSTIDILPSIRTPSLIISGKVDSIVNHKEHNLLSQKIPGSELFEISDAGHFPYVTHHEVFNKKVLTFIKAQDSQAESRNI